MTSWISRELKAKLQSKTSQWDIIIKARTHVALLWLLSLGRASEALLRTASCSREDGGKRRLDFSPSPPSAEPAVLTHLPQLQGKAATAFLEEVKLPCFLPASGALPLPPRPRLPVCVQFVALLQQPVREVVWNS